VKEVLSAKPIRIGIVVNEISGDMLGASLMRELRKLAPEVVFEGVGGHGMVAAGCNSLYPIERFSVMGLVEIMRHLPDLLYMRKNLRKHFLSDPPDLFIGIDAPDFNLKLERDLKRAGVTTVHYVCPSVWAWRANRVNKIRASADLVLSLFPFEKEFLKQHQVPAAFVGHTLADEIPMEPDQSSARERLGLASEDKVIAMLPGSRRGEVNALAEDFLGAAKICCERYPELRFVVPLVNQSIREIFEQIKMRVAPELPLLLVDGHAQDVMLSADAVLVASGTATLEAMLLQRPMVIAYRLHWLTHWILDTFKLFKSRYVSLANMLAGEEIAPEFIQDAVQPYSLAQALIDILESPGRVARVKEVSLRVHESLRQDASKKAAHAVLELLQANWNGQH